MTHAMLPCLLYSSLYIIVMPYTPLFGLGTDWFNNLYNACVRAKLVSLVKTAGRHQTLCCDNVDAFNIMTQ